MCSWEAQTTDQRFRSWVLITSNNCRFVLDSGLGISSNCPTHSVLSFEKIKQVLNAYILDKFKELPKVCDSGLWKFKQLHNDFGVGKFKKQPNGFDLGYRKFKTAQHLWSWEVQTTAQQFLIRVVESSNNFPTVLFTILENFKQLPKCFGFGSYVVLGLSKNFLRVLISDLWKLRQLTNCPVLNIGKFKQLLNTSNLGMRKQLHNKLVWGSSKTCSIFCSWEAQTTDQLFRSWVLGNSNNRPTAEDKGLRTFKQLLIEFCLEFGKCQTTAQRFQWRVLESSNNCLIVLEYGLGKFKQMINQFGLESCKIRPSSQRI